MFNFMRWVLEIASQVKNPVTAAVVTAGMVLCGFIAFLYNEKTKSQLNGKKLSAAIVLAVLIALLGLSPLVAKTYSDTYGAYVVRITVQGDDGNSVSGAKVFCSAGGEVKTTDGGFECDIPPRNMPDNGILTVHAAKPEAFLSGSNTIPLEGHHNLSITVQLKPSENSLLRGLIESTHGRAIEGAYVSVVGYGLERVRTGPDGGFALKTHAADGQMIKVHVESSGFNPFDGLKPAGGDPIVIRLER